MGMMQSEMCIQRVEMVRLPRMIRVRMMMGIMTQCITRIMEAMKKLMDYELLILFLGKECSNRDSSIQITKLIMFIVWPSLCIFVCLAFYCLFVIKKLFRCENVVIRKLCIFIVSLVSMSSWLTSEQLL